MSDDPTQQIPDRAQPQRALDLDSIGTWLGVLLAGASATFATVGISSEDVALVLRRDELSQWATVVLAMIASAVALSMVAIFVDAGTKVSVWTAAVLVSASWVPLPLVSALLPFSHARNDRALAVILDYLAIAVGFVVLGLVLRRLGTTGGGTRSRIRVQPVVLLCGVIMLAQGVTTAIRVEARVLNHDNHVTMSDIVDGRELTLSVTGERLATYQFVAVVAYGSSSQSGCAIEASDPEPTDAIADRFDLVTRGLPHAAVAGCELLARAVLRPDKYGNVEQTVSFSTPDGIRLVDAVATLCSQLLGEESDGYSNDCTQVQPTRIAVVVPDNA